MSEGEGGEGEGGEGEGGEGEGGAGFYGRGRRADLHVYLCLGWRDRLQNRVFRLSYCG